MSERENQAGDGEVGECHVCGKLFASQELLSRHLMDEHGEPPTEMDPGVAGGR